MSTAPKSHTLNWQMFGKLAVIVTVMFGFGWALVPIYKKICEVTGINVLTKTDKSAQEFAKNTQVDMTRRITVEFDANSRGPWQFKPEASSVEVRPGELATMVYTLINTKDQPTRGQAIPSYAPKHSAQYFRKIECFCFEQQDLKGNEIRKFPVVFVLDPNLPKDINTITLSYTFFEPAGMDKAAVAPVLPSRAPGHGSGG